MHNKKVSIISLGCKVNQYDSEEIMKKLSDNNIDVINTLDFADVYIVNTCAVTNEAEHKSRQMLTKIKKINPDAAIFICGCSSQNNPEPYRRNGVFQIYGTSKKNTNLVDDVISYINNLDFATENYLLKEDLQISNIYENDINTISTMTRKYIKVQDGCDNYCTYCLIPYVRGHCRSQTIKNIQLECEKVQENSSEIILIGINLSAYGIDLNSSLTALILSLTNIKSRIRLGSLEVNIITDEFLQATAKLHSFCPHFHLSLQSGDKNVLKDMNRHYTPEDYKNAVKQIRKYYPNAAITTDIIVGFPTETDDSFINSVNFAKEIAFSDIHVFPYSRRNGTKAAELKQLSGKIINKRMDIMLALKQELINKYLLMQIGQSLCFIPETFSDGYWCGHTENYVKIYCKDGEKGKITNIRPIKLFKDGLIGDIIK